MTIFSSALTLKIRAPDAPRQTWIIDEAARLSGFAQVAQLYTYGAGIGIRPWAIFQNTKQMRALSPEAESIICSSASLQSYFGVRDLETATRVSTMIGSETLSYDDVFRQSRAEALYAQALTDAVIGGADPFEVVLDLDQKRFETAHLTQQHRKLRTPDEILRLPQDHQVIFADGLQGAIYAQRAPYWQQAWMAGRYHPNLYHPPQTHVRVQTRWGPRRRPVITAPVPA